jgi:UDP-2,3-diacylglucosamine pyrophosphatase LpxH
LAKIEQIAAEHSVFFEALGQLLNTGFHVELIPGNHDIEITRTAVREKVKELIKRYGQCSDEAADRIRFHPWIYYVPGVFYAEHGQQQHWINCFPDLAVLINQETQGRILLPVGSHFEIYLQALRKANGRPEGEYSPSLRSLILSPVTHPAYLRRTAGAQVRFLGALLSAVFRAANRCKTPGGRLPARNPPALSSQTGLSIQALTALAQEWRCFDLAQVLSMLRKRVRKRTTGKAEPNYLYQSAMTIHELLRCKNEQVPYYVFGHTHKPAMQPLTGGGPVSYYVNGGSWAGEYDPVPQSLLEQAPERRLFRYIFITAQPGSGNIEARILAWNDSTQLSEMVLPQRNN